MLENNIQQCFPVKESVIRVNARSASGSEFNQCRQGLED